MDFWQHASPARDLVFQAHCVAVWRLGPRSLFLEREADRGLMLPTPLGLRLLQKLLGRVGYAPVPLAQLERLAEATAVVVRAKP